MHDKHFSRLTLASINCCDSDPSVRLGKVRSSAFPVEYELSRFIQKVKNPHESWRSDNEVIHWAGVYCESDKRTVNKIVWRGSTSGGELEWKHLPPTLLLLDIRKYNFETFRFSGSICTNDLPGNLEEFYAGCNRFEGGLDLAQLPQRLRVLSISCNNLSGGLSFVSLPESLRTLHLARNQFAGEVSFPVLSPDISVIDLFGNKVWTRQKEIPQLIRGVAIVS